MLGRPPVPFRYRDFGSLVNLSEYGAFDNLLDGLSGRSTKVRGVFARLMYRSLYRMHQSAVQGPLRTALHSVADLIARGTAPRVKLH